MIEPMLATRLADGLHAEATALGRSMRRYFGSSDADERHALRSAERLALASEALRGTTRLMLLTGALLARAAGRPPHAPLDELPAPGAELAPLPDEARRLLAATADLYERVRRLDRSIDIAEPPASPARSLWRRLERSL